MLVISVLESHYCETGQIPVVHVGFMLQAQSWLCHWSYCQTIN